MSLIGFYCHYARVAHKTIQIYSSVKAFFYKIIIKCFSDEETTVED